jgi:hypothetical protein
MQYYFVTERDMKWPHVHQHVMALTPSQLEAFLFGVKNRDPQTPFFVFPFLSFVSISFFLIFR